MKSRARVGATLSALAATATAALLVSATAQAAPGAPTPPTRTTLSATTHMVPYGGTAKLKAVVKPVTGTALPTGTVTFSEGATVYGTVALALVGTVETAKLDVPGLAVGEHDFTAHYSGSANFAASTSLPLTITVGLPSTTTTLSSTNGKMLVVQQPSKLKAVVKVKVAGTGTPSGTVTFYEGTTALAAPVALALDNGVWDAKLTVPAPSLGDHLYTAEYNGSATLAPSKSKVLTITVSKGATSIDVTEAIQPNGNTKFVATISGGIPGLPVTGFITFAIDNLAVQTQPVAFNKASQQTSSPLDPGTHTVKVSYLGDGSYQSSTFTLTFTV